MAGAGLESEGWRAPGGLPPLGDDEVQVWQVRLSEALAALPYFASLLNDEERRRAGRYIVEHPRDQFIVARGVLRTLLGHVLGVAPQAVLLTIGEHGKPALAGSSGIEFNVAHAKDVILIALRRRVPVGIDVEWLDPGMETLELAQTTFTPREAGLVAQAAPGRERLLAFYRCWTQKEAIVKADGRGLMLPLTLFEVPILDDAERALQSKVRVSAFEGRPEQIFDVFALGIGEDYIGTLATQTPCGDVLSCRFPLPGPSIHR
ncbi:4'-phosphopantetheinyl transferase [Granulicella rosea]|uniref:4'-phosphopantetheinyl transferase n=1 Tax=Granulicella rosea TaxID=474952 RepID=A0A239ESZ9_9BACT|nr:4'-phosphopantetheinyl transferase superfamily protein [Granulicella rosea]SNS47775.1 4'-phosphopantetheinyl transferase [Granulicella rosea]